MEEREEGGGFRNQPFGIKHSDFFRSKRIFRTRVQQVEGKGTGGERGGGCVEIDYLE